MRNIIILVLVEAFLFAFGMAVTTAFPQLSETIWFSIATLAAIAVPAVYYFEKLWGWIKSNFASFFLGAAAVSLMWLLGAGLLRNEPTTFWIHPSLSENEQDVIRAECRMRAYEAIPTPESPYVSYLSARENYFDACLISQGFTLEQAD
ncbi:MAG: hypothetical protein OXG90_07485 [Gammaproteobacteria bacterium]|nr:hypothetical protein [Gammaproteobacteria bacterium]